MGNIWSNRWPEGYIPKPIVQDCFILSLQRLTKEAKLNTISSFTLERGNKVWLKGDFKHHNGHSVLKLSNGQHITIKKHLMPNNASRYYIQCPQCLRAITKLYLPKQSNELLCRTCHGLGYLSSRESRKAPKGFSKASFKLF